MTVLDARIRHTLEKLRSALLDLMKEKEIHQITVKDLCARADVSRATFYKYFSDAGDLLDKMEKDLLSQMHVAISSMERSGTRELAMKIFEVVEQNKQLCYMAVVERRQNKLFQDMIDMYHDAFMSCWKKWLVNIDEEEMEMLFTGLTHGSLRIMSTHYPNIDKEKIANFINVMVNGALAPYLPEK